MEARALAAGARGREAGEGRAETRDASAPPPSGRSIPAWGAPGRAPRLGHPCSTLAAATSSPVPPPRPPARLSSLPPGSSREDGPPGYPPRPRASPPAARRLRSRWGGPSLERGAGAERARPGLGSRAWVLPPAAAGRDGVPSARRVPASCQAGRPRRPSCVDPRLACEQQALPPGLLARERLGPVDASLTCGLCADTGENELTRFALTPRPQEKVK